MQTQSQPTPRPAAQERAIKAFANAGLNLLGCKDTMPRVTTVLSADTELELERIAAWMNRYESLADRAKRRYSDYPMGHYLIDIVNTCKVISGIETDGSDSHDNRPTRTEQATFDAARAEAVATNTPRVALLVKEVTQ